MIWHDYVAPEMEMYVYNTVVKKTHFAQDTSLYCTWHLKEILQPEEYCKLGVPSRLDYYNNYY